MGLRVIRQKHYSTQIRLYVRTVVLNQAFKRHIQGADHEYSLVIERSIKMDSDIHN